ncbi:MAG: FAD-dependent oxidoreductase [Clostridiales bacterium]|jgi:NADPH-dependent glutamate synthase beta subunit-like oxidoreductase/NAD-dependent dihydropyrimidine dehydrogenase PreA subunit|nr:FAD-dependent oxidoreductase [Clostridiales bacterium]
MLPRCSETVAIPYKIGSGTVPVLVNKTGDWRFLTPSRHEKNAPCASACPLHSGISIWIDRVKEGDWQGAWAAVSRYNPFPAITGHVCYHFCENDCSRNHYDQSIAVGELEKEIGLWRLRKFASGEKLPVGRKLPIRVAVVGSGPAGLACAYYLAMLGLEVTVLEKQPVAGGMLALGIPEYRLPRNVLEQELAVLRSLGVVFRNGAELGRNITLAQLREDYQAVFLATGAGKEKKLNVPGEENPGVIGALEYLAMVHLGKKLPDFHSILVVGGGNAAVDAACTARMNGARVALAYRRTRDVMPAHDDEVRSAEEAGVQFLFQVQPDKIYSKSGTQTVVLSRTQSSRRGERISTVPNSSFNLACDLVIVATGQDADLSIAGEESLSFNGQSLITNLPGVFAGGDLISGPATVAAAIGAGREAARAMAAYLEIDQSTPDGPIIASIYNDSIPVAEYETLNPSIFPKQGRAVSPETEAGRCLSCGRCNRCGVCWVFCPDMAVAGVEFDINLDYCKGCGICAKECPGGVLEMGVIDSGTENHHR